MVQYSFDYEELGGEMRWIEVPSNSIKFYKRRLMLNLENKNK